MSSINTELVRRYKAALSSLPRLPDNVSSPLLIRVPEGYESNPRKLMVVGQQTFGWGSPEHSGTVEKLMEGYGEFDLAASYRPSPFWTASHELHKALNPDSPPRTFLWSNLVKVDQEGRRPDPAVEDAVARLDLLAMEIEVTQPDVVVFFTGPSYDLRLAATFAGIGFTEIAPGITTLKHPILPARSFRTYHPAYLRRSGKWEILSELAALASQDDFDPSAG